jgi:hypothetical protein
MIITQRTPTGGQGLLEQVAGVLQIANGLEGSGACPNLAMVVTRAV